MPPLSLPAPTLAFEPVAPGVAMLEKPIELRTGAIVLPDGTALGREGFRAAGLFVYRNAAAIAATEVWNDAAGAWSNAATVAIDGLDPLPLAFLPGDPLPWFGLFVAAGQKEASGADRFATASAGYPRYFFRSYFAPSDEAGAAATLSPPTPEVQFVGVADAVRAGVAAGPGQTLENATELHVLLRNAALRTLGSVSIFNDGGQASIEIAKWDGTAAPTARIRLETDGTLTINDSLRIAASGGDVTLSCSGTLTLSAAAVRAENLDEI